MRGGVEKVDVLSWNKSAKMPNNASVVNPSSTRAAEDPTKKDFMGGNKGD